MKRMEEALLRQNDEDIIYIGNIAEQLYYGAGGELLRAIIKGMVTQESRRYKDEIKTPADRCLGRIEAYNNIIDSIEQSIADGKEKNRPMTKEEVEETLESAPQGVG